MMSGTTLASTANSRLIVSASGWLTASTAAARPKT
ncbi:Uncharacterised protein [Mycobacteroides abscessus subsp. abscessus]|nr:Uncharacterised protein [Mycobacteroides abscessus subsp. abscessus]